jgi:hypothetical protein
MGLTGGRTHAGDMKGGVRAGGIQGWMGACKMHLSHVGQARGGVVVVERGPGGDIERGLGVGCVRGRVAVVRHEVELPLHRELEGGGVLGKCWEGVQGTKV